MGRAVDDLAVGGFVFLSGYSNFIKFWSKEKIGLKTTLKVIDSSSCAARMICLYLVALEIQFLFVFCC